MNERVDLDDLELLAGEFEHDIRHAAADALRLAAAELRRLRAMEERFTWRELRSFDDAPEDAGRYLIVMRFDEPDGDCICIGDWWANLWAIPVPGQNPMGFAAPWYWMPLPPMPQLPEVALPPIEGTVTDAPPEPEVSQFAVCVKTDAEHPEVLTHTSSVYETPKPLTQSEQNTSEGKP